MDKGIFRRENLALRIKMLDSDVADLSNIISNTLISLDIYDKSNIIALYCPFRNEVDLTSILDKGGKRFVFPKVEKGTKKLSFFEVLSLKDLTKGSFGILEPAEGLEKIEIKNIDLFAVPGVAFSQKCERIGYGGGFYDSTLPFISKNAVTAGISFDFQIIPSGFSEKSDISLDMVITEKQIIYKSTT